MRHGEIEQRARGAADMVSERVREYADDAGNAAQGLLQRGRRMRERFSGRGGDYRRQLSRAAEDFADEANYRYRRVRRQVKQHPVATVAIVAGTIGAFLLLRRVFRSDDE